MAQLDYPNEGVNSPAKLALRLLEFGLEDNYTPDRAIGFALLAINDVLLVLNDTLEEIMYLLDKP